MNSRDQRDGIDLRPEIALGWRRSALSGLDPGMEVKEPRLFDVDRHSRLLRAADPVLTRMVDELNDTRFSVLLADHRARIVDRRLGQPALHRLLDKVKAFPGAEYVEELSGTNSLATAFELRKPIAIAGREHFLEALQVFCCYGAPIVHPITRRLEGVLDITGPVEDFSTLLGPFLLRAVHDIEQRLQEGSRLTEQRLFAAFQAESARTKNPVMMLTENVAFSNAAALELFSSTDHVVLRTLFDEIGVSSSAQVNRALTLSSGREVDLALRLANGVGDGVVVEAVPRDPESRESVRDRRTLSRTVKASGRVVLVVGEPGTGRTTRAQSIAGSDAETIDFADLTIDVPWRSRLESAADSGRTIVADNIHLMSETDAAFARVAIRGYTSKIVMASSTLDARSEEHRALGASADDLISMPALRDSPHSIGAACVGMLATIARENSAGQEPGLLRLAPSALDLLVDQPWPGNFTELRRVLTASARGRSRGDITAQDLPSTHRVKAGRKLSALERAERDAIVEALDSAGGNKAAAAVALGIGRTTLYQRIRYYHLPV